MFEFITTEQLAEKVVVTLAAKPIAGAVSTVVKFGYSKIVKDSPEDRVAKALAKALDKAALGNEFWKDDVKRQIEEVIQILVLTLNNPRYTDDNPLPNYIDKNTIDCFKDCLKADPVAWDYIKEVRLEDILKEFRDKINKIDEGIERLEDPVTDTRKMVSEIHHEMFQNQGHNTPAPQKPISSPNPRQLPTLPT